MPEGDTDRLTSEERSPSFGQTFDELKSIMDKMGSKDRLEALRALSGLYGHRVLPGTGAMPPTARNVPLRERAKPSPQKSKKSPAQQKTSQQISLLNKEISLKSRNLGTKLPDSDPLLMKRAQLFRDLKEGASGQGGEGSSPPISSSH